MKTYYTEARARSYNQTWRGFSEKTHSVVLALLESHQAQAEREPQQPLRILDFGCGTGLLLAKLARLYPEAELFGVDASQPMLDQARLLLGDRVQLSLISFSENRPQELPFSPASFDVITCANTLHYLPDPQALLQAFEHVLGPTGWLVLEDYGLRGFPFPWKRLEWVVRLYDPQHVRLYTPALVQDFSRQVGLQVVDARNFKVNLVFQGWALLLKKSEARIPQR